MHLPSSCIFSLFLLIVFVSVAVSKKCDVKKREYACYFTNWAHYRAEPYAYDVDKHYEPGLCSMIFYAFAVFDTNTYEAKVFDEATDVGGKQLYAKINGLKKKSKGLKTILSFGGYKFSEGGAFENMAKNGADTFIRTAINFTRWHGFDGIDIDWEYPNDKALFVNFLKKMSAAIKADGKSGKSCKDAGKTGCKKLLLTAAVSAGSWRVGESYDIPQVQKYLDKVMLMTYDLHGPWEPATGANAALDASDGISVKAGVALWEKGGTPRSKIMVGLPTYGHGWKTTSTKLGEPGNGMSSSLPITQQGGFAAYFEICDGGKYKFDMPTKTAITVRNGEMFNFDDVKSFQYKAKWIHDECYAGAFVWDLNQDDFLGKCKLSKGKKNPLTNAMKAGMLGQSKSPKKAGKRKAGKKAKKTGK